MLKNPVISRVVLVVSLLLLVGSNCSSQIITTIAGNGVGTGTYTGDGGPATAAGLDMPCGITMDRWGNLYVTKMNNTVVRKISTTGIISTIAGTGVSGYNGDDIPASAAQLKRPGGVIVDDSGRVIIAESGGYRVRRVATNDTISTIAGIGIAGSGGDGGPATAAQLGPSFGMVIDKNGNLYVANQSIQRIRKITPAGVISTFAGNGTTTYAGDGGPATNAGLYSPLQLAIDRKGNIYIAVIQQNCIRKVDTSGIITTVAGTGVFGYSGDGGQATAANLRGPNGVAVDTNGNLYIADCSSHRIRKVDTFGVITTFAGTGVNSFSGDGGPATAATLSYPTCVYLDSAGHLYVTDGDNDRVRKITMPSATLAVKDLAANNVRVYPVPVNDELLIENATPGSSISIFSPEGRLVFTGTIRTGREKISTRTFTTGTYHLLLTDPAGNKISRTIVK